MVLCELSCDLLAEISQHASAHKVQISNIIKKPFKIFSSVVPRGEQFLRFAK